MSIKKIKWYIIIIFFIKINNLYSKNIINKIKAKSFILVDYNSKKILIQKNSNKKYPPASLTKIMTSYILSDTLKSKKKKKKIYININKESWYKNKKFNHSSLMFLNKNEKVNIKKINKGMIIQSGNDACVAIATYISKNENQFITLMNKYSKNIGLENTQFKTVHGLDNNQQHTTSKDLIKLSMLLIKHFPKEYKIYKEKKFTYNKITQNNRNNLLWNKNILIDGIKTGHTDKSKYNIAVSAIKGKRRLILILLGNNTIKERNNNSIKLLKWGFKKYKTYQINKYNKYIKKKTFYNINKNIYITNIKKKKIYIKIFKNNFFFFKKNQIIGKIFFFINKKKNKKTYFLTNFKNKNQKNKIHLFKIYLLKLKNFFWKQIKNEN